MDERIAVAVGDVFSIASIGWFDAFDRFALVADHVLFCAIGVSDEFVIDATEDDLIVAYIFFAFGFGTFVLDSVANEAGFYVCAILDDIRAIFGDFVVFVALQERFAIAANVFCALCRDTCAIVADLRFAIVVDDFIACDFGWRSIVAFDKRIFVFARILFASGRRWHGARSSGCVDDAFATLTNFGQARLIEQFAA